MNKLILSLLGILLLTSCAKRNLAYLSDLEATGYAEEVSNVIEPEIQPDDLLSISVTSLSPEGNMLFNRGEVIPAGATANYGAQSSYLHTNSNLYREGYLVDPEGFIDFPVLGRVHIAGLTKAEAKEMLKQKLEKVLINPIINIRYLNYTVTVVGEVNRPGTFTIPSERINIIEALGLAGDMTAYGKRENVLIMREEEGVRKATRLNLNSKEVLSSPYFYLQPKDVVYVEPHRMKKAQVSTDTRWIAIAGSALSVLILAISRF
ncbi:polysaccharide biosynthesis/export family protein [Nafulsella turpanensis]|uniref:polysaccharide biosynthesis/export family protein n=1 Tax=Nafulsella turpanensis TaxID=1265690 RepID=UPI00034940E1|nr:polysaccharide biosynthesis/export family protein [Nafulsella turpanensis]